MQYLLANMILNMVWVIWCQVVCIYAMFVCRSYNIEWSMVHGVFICRPTGKIHTHWACECIDGRVNKIKVLFSSIFYLQNHGIKRKPYDRQVHEDRLHWLWSQLHHHRPVVSGDLAGVTICGLYPILTAVNHIVVS